MSKNLRQNQCNCGPRCSFWQDYERRAEIARLEELLADALGELHRTQEQRDEALRHLSPREP